MLGAQLHTVREFTKTLPDISKTLKKIAHIGYEGIETSAFGLVDLKKVAELVEDNGLITFLKFAKQTKDITGKNMFIQLAMDEHEHRLILEKQLNQLLEGGKWVNIEVPKSEAGGPKPEDRSPRT